jgi:excisionase family DNA binding protein
MRSGGGRGADEERDLGVFGGEEGESGTEGGGVSDLLVTLTVDELKKLVRECVRAEVEPREDAVLTRDEVAKMLRCNARTVVTYVEKHGLPAHKIERDWRFFRSEVLAWMKARDR